MAVGTITIMEIVVVVFLEGISSPYSSFCKENKESETNPPVHFFRLLNTVDGTTKDLPVVGGVTSPLLKTVGGVTDQLPIVS